MAIAHYTVNHIVQLPPPPRTGPCLPVLPPCTGPISPVPHPPSIQTLLCRTQAPFVQSLDPLLVTPRDKPDQWETTIVISLMLLFWKLSRVYHISQVLKIPVVLTEAICSFLLKLQTTCGLLLLANNVKSYW